MPNGKFGWFELELGLAGPEGLDLSLKKSVRVLVGPYGSIKRLVELGWSLKSQCSLGCAIMFKT